MKTTHHFHLDTTHPGGLFLRVDIDHRKETVTVECRDRDGTWLKAFECLEFFREWLCYMAGGKPIRRTIPGSLWKKSPELFTLTA